jgi:lantibiotic modifying enzyme
MDKDNLLERIADHLIMNASFLPDLGLYHGKMGIVIFFAHYARYTGETLYDDFAGELLNEIYEEIHVNMPINFESGLCGIGWGMEYLLENKFTEGDPDEILSDIDNRIMDRNLHKITDLSMKTGLEGIFYYIEKRLNSSCQRKKNLPFDESFLANYESIKNKNKIHLSKEKKIFSMILEDPPGDENITRWEYGIENGCAGYGLNYLLK